MNAQEVIETLRHAIISLNEDLATKSTQVGLDNGMHPVDIVNGGIRPALEILGKKFSLGDVFLPELMLAAKVADAAVNVLEPQLIKMDDSGLKLGKVLLATVKGDIHDIGKNIVALLMKSAGFEVVDIGVDKSCEEIMAAAKQYNVDIIGLSALLTTTILRMKDFVELLQESGIRNQYKVIVGGAPVTSEFADMIGADGYGADATHAVSLARRLVIK